MAFAGTLGALIQALERADLDYVPQIGFTYAHSYRGHYEQLAFEPTSGVSVAHMLDIARGALGCTFEGYKGGEYKMYEHTEVWIANYGRSDGSTIGPVLLAYLTGASAPVYPD